MQRKIIVVGLKLLFVVLVIISLVKLTNENRKESDFIQKNWIEVTAKINRVMRSGIRNKQSTILYIEYMYYDEKKRATIIRSGYIENTYNKGDYIKIFINPDDINEIK